jgi:hypothetical protein
VYRNHNPHAQAPDHQAVENFKEGRFRTWSGDTYQENQVLELTYNAIENLRKGFKDLDHPQFDTTHRTLDLIVKEAEESGDYDEALGKVLALTKERVTSQKETTTPTPSQKTRPKRKQEVFNLESSSQSEEEEPQPKKRTKTQVSTPSKSNKESELIKRRIVKAVDRLKEDLLEIVDDLLG